MKFKFKITAFILFAFSLSLSSCVYVIPSAEEPSNPSVPEVKYTIDFDLNGGSSQSYKGPVEVSEFSKDIFFFDCVKVGHSFKGWSYENTKILDEAGNLVSDIPELQQSMTFVALYSINTARMDVNVNIENAGTITGTGVYEYGAVANLNAKANKGYTFEGWYLNNEKLSSETNYQYTMGEQDVTLEARFTINSYTLRVVSSHPTLGEVKIEGDTEFNEYSTKTVQYLSQITVYSQSLLDEEGFLGWFDSNGNKLADSVNYLVTMGSADYTIFAKWDAPSYQVNVTKNNDKAGSVDGSGSYAYGSTVVLSADTNDGYEFVGWNNNGTIISDNPYTFTISDDITLEAQWNIKTYSITYILNGGVLPDGETNPSTYTVEDVITLKNPTLEGHSFAGWYLSNAVDADPITTITGMSENLTLVAKWSIQKYSVTVIPSDKGTVTGSGEYEYNSNVTLTATANDGYEFVGWYDSEDNEVSTNNPYTFKMPDNNVTLKTNWEIITYTISYELNGGTNHTDNPTTYTVEDTIPLEDPTKVGYTFTGWTIKVDDTETPIDIIGPGKTGNLYLIANWSINSYKVTVTSSNETRGTVSGSGEYEYGSSVTVTAIPNNGYKFIEWVNENDASVSDIAEYTFTLENKDVTLKAKWDIIKYTITYELNGGEIATPNPSEYDIETSVAFINSPTKVGHTFAGWTLNDNPVTQIEKGTTGDLTIVATWTANDYEVKVTNTDATMGSVSGDGIYKYGDSVTLNATANDGYEFVSWDNDGTIISDNPYVFTISEDTNLSVNWEIITYTITYDLNGGTLSTSNPESYTVKDSFTLNNPTKTGYTCSGWKLEDNIITSIEEGTTGNLTLIAQYVANKYNVNINSSSDEKGIVSGGGIFEYSDSVTVEATPIGDCVFKGWVDQNNTLVSKETSYTFTMPDKDVTLSALFWTKAEEAWYIANGIYPKFDSITNTITYGLYPQTNVNDDETLVATLDALAATKDPDDNGWYLLEGENEYEGVYYARYTTTTSVYEQPYFDNDLLVEEGKEYWFRCEPITWKILPNQDCSDYYLTSFNVLDAHCYHASTSERTIDGNTIYPNNYEYSDIRTWLNNDFYNSAFALNSSETFANIVDTNIDNISDKVFLLSYDEYFTASYFSDNNARQCISTDYARARGIYWDDTSYKSTYSTRTPSGIEEKIKFIQTTGASYIETVNTSYLGVRPAITLHIA